jgi:large subunit ribosomal protein L21
VSPGDELLVERTQADLKQGDDLVFDRVMLVSRGDAVSVGQPVVEGASVKSQVVAPVRGDKIIVFKKKRRKGYKKTQGHRQDYYRVRVESIKA